MKELRGEEACGRFCALEKDDIAPVQEAESDDKATQKLERLDGRESCSQKSKPSKKDMSWTWTESGGPEDNDMVLLHECMLLKSDLANYSYLIFSCPHGMVKGISEM